MRACFLEGLRENPELAPLLPFVRLWYSRPSTYTWRDEHNKKRSESSISEKASDEKCSPSATPTALLQDHSQLYCRITGVPPLQSDFYGLSSALKDDTNEPKKRKETRTKPTKMARKKSTSSPRCGTDGRCSGAARSDPRRKTKKVNASDDTNYN